MNSKVAVWVVLIVVIAGIAAGYGLGYWQYGMSSTDVTVKTKNGGKVRDLSNASETAANSAAAA